MSFFVPKLSSSESLAVTFVVYVDSTVAGQVFGGTVDTTAAGIRFEVMSQPPAGVHTFAVNAFVSTGTLTVDAGTGGSGELVPGFLRVTKA